MLSPKVKVKCKGTTHLLICGGTKCKTKGQRQMYRAKFEPTAGYIMCSSYWQNILLYKPFTFLDIVEIFPYCLLLKKFQHPYTITILCLSNSNAYQKALASFVLAFQIPDISASTCGSHLQGK